MKSRLYRLGKIKGQGISQSHKDYIGEYGFLCLKKDSFTFEMINGVTMGAFRDIETMETSYGVWLNFSDNEGYRFDNAYCATELEPTEHKDTFDR